MLVYENLTFLAQLLICSGITFGALAAFLTRPGKSVFKWSKRSAMRGVDRQRSAPAVLSPLSQGRPRIVHAPDLTRLPFRQGMEDKSTQKIYCFIALFSFAVFFVLPWLIHNYLLEFFLDEELAAYLKHL